MNENAEKHECMMCDYGGVWHENGHPCGNVCKHPDITEQDGLYYGYYHSYKTLPKICPFKQDYPTEKGGD